MPDPYHIMNNNGSNFHHLPTDKGCLKLLNSESIHSSNVGYCTDKYVKIRIILEKNAKLKTTFRYLDVASSNQLYLTRYPVALILVERTTKMITTDNTSVQ